MILDLGWILKLVISALMREIEMIETHREESHIKTAEMGVMHHKPKNTRTRCQKRRKDCPLEAVEGMWPCQHLNLRLLTSRTVIE